MLLYNWPDDYPILWVETSCQVTSNREVCAVCDCKHQNTWWNYMLLSLPVCHLHVWERLMSVASLQTLYSSPTYSRIHLHDCIQSLCVHSQPHCPLSYLNSKQCTLCAQPASLPVSVRLQRTIGLEYFVLECVFMTLLVAVLQHLVTVLFWM